MDELTLRKFGARIAEIEAAVYRQRQRLPALRVAPEGAGGPGRTAREAASWPPLPVGGKWGGFDRTIWLYGELVVPAAWTGETVVLRVRLGDHRALTSLERLVGPEALAYLDGDPYAGIDAYHDAILLTQAARGNERWQLAIEAYSARLADQHTLLAYELATRDAEADRLTHDLAAAYDVLTTLDPDGFEAATLALAIDAALERVDFRQPGTERFYASLPPARLAFAAALAGYRHGSRPRIVATGHAHLDIAWLWPLAQARRKAARTVATALRLMEQYPEYHFTQSQPWLFQNLRQDEPHLWAQVMARVAEGRWEPTGVLWVEADTNLPSGESLVRQIVEGQRFFAAAFGRRARVAWLPDAFGYSWALPKILRGAGIRHFLTSKISWNQYNRFPYDTFRWRGPDGSDVLAHFITTPLPDSPVFTYNGHMTAAEVAGTYRVYRQKDVNDRLLYLFGWGDGGGGPTREMLERARRFDQLPGMPALEHGGAEAFFAWLDDHTAQPARARSLPIWEGELYLELHRGTYTSQGRTKLAHRRAEILLQEAELWSALAGLTGAQSPDANLDDAWQLLLTHQFHDILPGSSIADVYTDAERDLATVARQATMAIEAAIDHISTGAARPDSHLATFNATPWPRTDPVECLLDGIDASEEPVIEAGGQPLDVQRLAPEPTGEARWLVAPPAEGVPALGYDTWTLRPAARGSRPAGTRLTVTTTQLESPLYRLELDERGLIRSLRDKRIAGFAGGREVIAPGEAANQLIAFEDKPIDYDAWDIDIFYQEKPYNLDALDDLRVIERGPLRGGVELRRRFLDSTVVQRLLLYRDSPRIDVQTEIDWREHQILLKAAFPVAVRAGHAIYEIQFGTIERPTHWNTSWDRARFEVPAQRWADLSEGDYGVALLNDGKYGYDIRGQVLRLTLLKSAIMPDPNADQGLHRFTYSLLPHSGDWRTGEVIRHATALNSPLRVRRARAGHGLGGPPRASFLAVERPGLVISTVKPALDGRGIIIRLYEAFGTRGPATLRFAHRVLAAEECDLLEERHAPLERDGEHAVRLHIHPYALKTLRVRLAAVNP